MRLSYQRVAGIGAFNGFETFVLVKKRATAHRSQGRPLDILPIEQRRRGSSSGYGGTRMDQKGNFGGLGYQYGSSAIEGNPVWLEAGGLQPINDPGDLNMNQKQTVLFICQHNSGRSQIAEAYLKQLAGEYYEVESAGLEPTKAVNPLVVEVMLEEGIDLSRKKPQSVFELFKAGKLYNHVVTVCHDSESKCPIFPGITKRWHLAFPDPSKVEGNREEKLAKVREIRDAIKQWLLNRDEGSFLYTAGDVKLAAKD